MLTLTRPLVVFDLETTGKEVARDRIVEIAVVAIMPDGTQRVSEWLVNPGVAIPAEATKIHGLSDEDVALAPTFAELAPKLASMFSRADVSGFNARGFDVPMLDCEFARAGFNPSPLDGCRIVDAKDIFHKQEPRDLAAAVKFYCGEDLQGAHGAKADALAAAKVLLAQIERYALPRTVDELADKYQPADRYVDPTRKIIIDASGAPAINFGQHKGQKLADLAKTHPDYLQWILKGEWHPKVITAVKSAIARKEAA